VWVSVVCVCCVWESLERVWGVDVCVYGVRVVCVCGLCVCVGCVRVVCVCVCVCGCVSDVCVCAACGIVWSWFVVVSVCV